MRKMARLVSTWTVLKVILPIGHALVRGLEKAEMTENCQCEGPCVCAEIESLVEAVGNTKVRTSALLLPYMFDIGSGESVQDGTHVLSVVIHGTDGPSEDGEAMLRLSFNKESAYKMIACSIQAYNELWGGERGE